MTGFYCKQLMYGKSIAIKSNYLTGNINLQGINTEFPSLYILYITVSSTKLVEVL